MTRHRKFSIDVMQWIAEQRGGKCLSDNYVNDLTKLKWQCSKSHLWEARPSNIVYGKTWCPTCAGKKPNGNTRRSISTDTLTINQMKDLAKQRGGLCLSNKYINCYTKLRWQCEKGHIWNSTAKSVKHRKAWCPLCLLRRNTTRKPFAGKITIDDMKKLAHSKNGKCLSKEYINAQVNLRWQCEKGHIWDAPYFKMRYESWCLVCAEINANASQKDGIIIHTKRYRAVSTINKFLNELQEIARYNKGKCLSTFYINAYTELRWQCNKGHTWMASPRTIQLRQRWCPHCPITKYDDTGLNKLRFFKEALKFANKLGGACLSTQYAYKNIDKVSILRWQCSKGHTWKEKPQGIISGNWCPLCAKAQSFLDKLRRLVQNQGVKCLSTEYFNEAKNLRWKCSKGHIWEAPPRKIKTSKKFCPVCNASRQSPYSFALYEKAC